MEKFQRIRDFLKEDSPKHFFNICSPLKSLKNELENTMEYLEGRAKNLIDEKDYDEARDILEVLSYLNFYHDKAGDFLDLVEYEIPLEETEENLREEETNGKEFSAKSAESGESSSNNNTEKNENSSDSREVVNLSKYFSKPILDSDKIKETMKNAELDFARFGDKKTSQSWHDLRVIAAKDILDEHDRSQLLSCPGYAEGERSGWKYIPEMDISIHKCSTTINCMYAWNLANKFDRELEIQFTWNSNGKYAGKAGKIQYQPE